MSMARAMERGSDERWRGATYVPRVHTTRWTHGDHAAMREYLAAHEGLPGQPEAVPEEEVCGLAAQLYSPRSRREERKRILVFLAHHGSERAASELRRFADQAGPELRGFAELALEDATRRSAAESGPLGRHNPCPCGSGRKFKDCCAQRLG